MKTAFEYWKEKFGEEPQTDSERLAVAFAATYAEQAIDHCAKIVEGSAFVEAKILQVKNNLK